MRVAAQSQPETWPTVLEYGRMHLVEHSTVHSTTVTAQSQHSHSTVTSDCKHRSASGKHQHPVEPIPRDVQVKAATVSSMHAWYSLRLSSLARNACTSGHISMRPQCRRNTQRMISDSLNSINEGNIELGNL